MTDSLAFSLNEENAIALFGILVYDGTEDKYLVPLIDYSDNNQAPHFLELHSNPSNASKLYTTKDGSITLTDNGSSKTLLTAGTKYIFVLYPDTTFRCASIKNYNGLTLDLVYTANGLHLHGIYDTAGRTLYFNYTETSIRSITQTWIANSIEMSQTWTVESLTPPSGDNPDEIKYAHTAPSKILPANAVLQQYTTEMEASDELLARIFGGPNSIAAANSFEPAGLSAPYPLYRGDVIGDDGEIRQGHLAHAMHLYGTRDGTGDSPLYVPIGFTDHSKEPSPTDSVVTFYYPQLGDRTNVTIAIFHVRNYELRYEGSRVRIGDIGGPGGSSPQYRHSHIEFYSGNCGLPKPEDRSALRLDPATIFVLCPPNHIFTNRPLRAGPGLHKKTTNPNGTQHAAPKTRNGRTA